MRRTNRLTTRRQRSRRLLVESLEGRRLLATIDLAALDPDQATVVQGAGQSGFSVSGAGDVNGDGFDDLLIGAPYGYGPTSGSYDAGRSYVVYGSASPPQLVDLATLGTDGVTIRGNIGGDQIGRSVGSAGDVNGDGFDDLVIGGPYVDGKSGDTYIVFGGPALPSTIDVVDLGSRGVTISGRAGDDHSGWSADGAGDINGDGLDDVIIGAFSAGGAGESYVIYGSTALPETLNLASLPSGDGITISGVGANDESGASVSGAGDVNGDGFDDLVIASPAADAADDNKTNAGDSYIVFGGPSLPDDIDLVTLDQSGVTIFGSEADDQIGGNGQIGRSHRTIRGAGDVNGDGLDDVIIGAVGADADGNLLDGAGESYLIYGATNLPTTIDLAALGTAGVTLFGAGAGDESGFSVSGSGDVNGDGFDDLIIGARYADADNDGKENAGDSYVVFGGPALPPTIDLSALTTDGFAIYGADAGDHQGRSVSGAGDFDGDGFDDFVTGAHRADSFAGSSYLIFGSDLTDAVTHAGTDADESLVGTAGADVMVGGRGDDTLVGNQGADVLRGGEGDDVLGVGDLAFARLRGGNGTDTLRLDAGGLALDLTTLAENAITDVEQIDITGSGGNVLTLDLQAVLNISSHSNTLLVRRGVGAVAGEEDDVNFGAGWTQVVGEMIDGDSFAVFTQGEAILKLQVVPYYTVAHSGGITSPAEHGIEEQKTDSFTVALTQQPTGDVVVNVTSGDTEEATVSPAILTFTPTDWDQPQSVTVSGVVDDDNDGDQLVPITLAVDPDATDDIYYDTAVSHVVQATVLNVPNTPQVTAPSGGFHPELPTFAFENVENETGYSVWVVDMSLLPASLAYSSIDIPADATSFTIPEGSELIFGHSYRYFLRADNAVGFSLWNGTTPGAPYGEFAVGVELPTAPPLAPVANAVDPGTGAISWDPSPGADYYAIYLINVDTGTVVTSQNGIMDESFVPDPALPDGQYRVWLSGINIAGSSGFGAHFDFDVGAPVTIPAAPTAEAVDPATQEISWQPSAGATSYGVYLISLDTGTLVESRGNLMTNSFTPSPALAEGTYRIWVNARNSAGSSGFGGLFDFEIGEVGVPAPPVGLTATGIDTSRPTLQWDAVPGAGIYGIYLINMDTLEAVTSFQQTSTSVTLDIDLIAGNYRYWVRAINGQGTGPWSDLHDFEITLG